MTGNFLWVCKTGCAAAVNGSVLFKWLYLEQARASVHALRGRRYKELLEACETVLKVQEGLRPVGGRVTEELKSEEGE